MDIPVLFQIFLLLIRCISPSAIQETLSAVTPSISLGSLEAGTETMILSIIIAIIYEVLTYVPGTIPNT